VTSSQPVATPNAINYTPDNLHAYAFSGVVASAGSQSSATTRTLLFETLSGYLKIRLTFSNTNISTTANEYYLVKFNDQIVYKAENEHGLDTVTNPTVIYMIIPPFTKVETLVGTSADGYDFTTIISGKAYGMTETGFQ